MRTLHIASTCAVALVTAGAFAQAGEQDVAAMTDYAWGFPVVVSRDASFYSIELPLEFNQSVVDPDLRDAGVYNAAGAPVPRVFRKTRDDVKETEHLRPLPMIPLYENSPRTADDVRLLFERDGDKTRVEFNTDGLQQEAIDDELVAYIVDTRQLKNAIEALELTWAPTGTGFLGRITVEGGNDLENWREVGSGAVADLQENSASILQRRVRLSKSSHDFLRVRWKGLPKQWRLTGVEGYYETGVKRAVRKFNTLDSSDTDPDDGGLVFDLGGAPRVDRVRVVLTQPNTVISATLYYRRPDQQGWHKAAAGSHYHIGRGDDVVTSSAIRLNEVRTGRFKVVVTHGQPNPPMRLEIGWRPDTLIFVAQGQGPFALAAGRAADEADGFPMNRFYSDRSIVNLSAVRRRVADATLGPRYTLRGEAALRPGAQPDWRRLSLWTGLVLGVAFVGFMANRVIRDLRNDESA